MLTWDEFRKVDMRVGRVTKVEDFPKAKNPAYKLTIDFGPLGIKMSSAHVTHYSKKELEGRLIVAVVNFPPKQVADFSSEVLVLGAVESNGNVVLLEPDKDAELGSRIA
jgi:tRNA-binding protein